MPSIISPFIDLHRHLDGNVRPSTILSLAREQGHVLAGHTQTSIEALVFVDNKCADLLTFLEKLDYGVSVLNNPDACYRIAYENVEDAFKEGIDYIELRFSPYYMAKTHQLDMKHVVAAVVNGVNDGMLDFKIKVSLIGILSRTFGVDVCERELDAILTYRREFVAVDLAGDELGFPPELFIAHFERVRRADLKATIHAGEVADSQAIWTAIESLHASRIGHGVNAINDPQLMDVLAIRKIGIESCISSNYQTGAWEDVENHPLKTFMNHEIEVCLCTDDPGVSNIDLQHEYDVAKSKLNLNEKSLCQLALNAKSQAFAY